VNIHIKDGYLITPSDDGSVKVEQKDIFVEDGVLKFQKTFEKTDKVLDVKGKVILPGLVNTHHHIYSCLSKGIPCQVPFVTFEKTLAQLWWLLDQALDSQSTQLSTVLSVRDSLKMGVTTVFDHHISGNIENSLSEMGDIFMDYGVNGCLAFEATNRNGHSKFEQIVNENDRFARENKENPLLKGLIGMHALLTLTNENLKYLADKTSAPIHCHVAEGFVDQEYSWRDYNKSIIERLDQFGLLRDNSLIVHGSNLKEQEIELLAKKKIFMSQAIDSNMNNALNVANIKKFVDAGLAVTAGTDGMHSSALKAQKNSYEVCKFINQNPDVGFPEAINMFISAYQIKKNYGFPLGVIEGEKADLAIMDYIPATPFDENSFYGHYIFGISESVCQFVIKEDKILLDNYKINQSVDAKYQGMMDNAIGTSEQMFARFLKLQKESTYLDKKYNI